MKALVKNKIVSEKEFAQAEQNYENARISYEAVAKNHSAGGQAVTSPICGYVKNILVKEGDYVTVGQPLVSITQNRRLFLRAEVSEKYYPYLRTIGSANFKTPYNNKVYELKDLNGRLFHSVNRHGATTRSMCRSLSNSTIKETSFRARSLKYILLSSPYGERTVASPHGADRRTRAFLRIPATG